MIMDKSSLVATREWVKKELDACVDFWLKNGLDKKHGGVYTCLDRTGRIYSTDKSVWMQGRCAWTFWKTTASTTRLEEDCISR